MNEEEFNAVLKALHGEEVTWRDSYDAIFHLVTAANGAEAFYSAANNAARYETVEQAVELDSRLAGAWTGHRYLRIIDNSTGFEEKMRRLEEEIAIFLGEERPYEMERKFLIRFPDLAVLKQQSAKKASLVQTYLVSENNASRRIRKLEDPHLAEIPIMAMTANAFKEDVEASKEAGMQEHIAKPIDVNELMSKLRSILK